MPPRASRLRSLLAATLAMVCVSAPLSAAAGPAGWVQVWADEFNQPQGTGPDRNKWNMEIGNGSDGWGNKELQYYTDRTNNAVVDQAGNLVLIAWREQWGNCWHGGACQYTSARMTTRGKFERAYGRFEARMKLPVGQGIWPAFWMLGNDIDTARWPNCGEIDIMENVGREPYTVHGTIHGPGYSGAQGIGASKNSPDGRRYTDGFHDFAVEWSPTDIKWFVDGQLYQQRTAADLRGNRWVFDHRFFMILNLAVGGNWPGSPDGSTVFPQHLVVDWVRVFEWR
ncbi:MULTISPECIES: family 16 glycosylhydrolase [unclassified Crossiella]|uniref:glycoside hydrolase family 16 protein n=1 Tax=unclassified Crossiella TaxID=2620835 RepID=UPI001FFFEFFC|nr:MULTISPECIES: glycoside hydrolase family 16 protein [unclassified Crossiella]MCK2244119.1 glycoside hydrolase family 16 protein [Crossiella sp. S99.2]MCK2257923.1 glycoside hydrolase family 16 protein [Crossiella sp. S99.1]